MNLKKILSRQKQKKVIYDVVGRDDNGEELYACICPTCSLSILQYQKSDGVGSESDNPKVIFRDCFAHHAYEGQNQFCSRCGQVLDWN